MKKSLLTESEIRKFMKFANIGTLTENFIDNNEAAPEMPGDEAPESGEMAPDDEEPDMDALMQEVTRRVAARLLKENKR